MLSKVRKAIGKFNMLDKTECVTVALSGGADSVALLYALKMLGYNIIALHVNHQLRGEESDRDEAFVCDICEKENIPLEVYRVDVSGEAKKRSMGLEECGREIRYELLAQSARKNGCKIATAHTLSDNAETVLLNMARGCGLSGLTGIPPVRGNIIRPLILASREDIEKFCQDNNLSFVTDSTNLTDDYARNRIRHNAVTALETVNSAFLQAVSRMTDSLSDDEDFIDSTVMQAEKLRTDQGYRVDDLRTFHSAICSRLLMSEYRRATGETCSYLHVGRMKELIDKGQGRAEMPGNVFAVIRKGFFVIEQKREDAEEFSFSVSLPYEAEICGKKIKIEKMNISSYEEMKKNNRYLFKNAFDYDIISSNIVVRNRRSGDKLKQTGRGVTKEMRRLMNEKGIPQAERSRVFVIADGENLVWAEHFGTDEKYAVSEKTGSVVVIKVESGN